MKFDIPKGKFSSGDANAGKRKKLLESLRSGEEVRVKSDGSIQQKGDADKDHDAVKIPKGKLAFHWYEDDVALYEGEVAGMNQLFPQFTEGRTENGNMYWHGKINSPSCPSPNPISSSAHSIPLLSTPRIFAFLMVKASPFIGWMVVPGKATITFCPAATFGAPQTIGKISPEPVFTVVTFSLSASGCFSQVITSPATNPSNPPFTLSNAYTPSTSKPISVSNSAAFSALIFTGKISCNQFQDIFMG